VCASGAVDHLVGSHEGQPVLVRVFGGSPLQPRVTANGCALGALVAAYQAVAEPLVAAIAAHASFAIAGSKAAMNHTAPGSFAIGFIDELYRLDEATMRARTKSEVSALDTLRNYKKEQNLPCMSSKPCARAVPCVPSPSRFPRRSWCSS